MLSKRRPNSLRVLLSGFTHGSRKGALLTIALTAASLGAVMTVNSPSGTVTIDVTDPEIRVSVLEAGKVIEVADANNAWTVRLREGKYEVALQTGDDRLELSQQQLLVRRGDTTRVAVKQGSAESVGASTRPTPHVAVSSDTFAGQWRIEEAHNFAGEPYRGRVTIRLADNGLASLAWLDEQGNSAQTGLGFVRGEHLLAAWGVKRDFGVMLYKIHQDGSLHGLWTHCIAPQRLGREVATGGTAGKLGGEYQVRGSSIAEAGGDYSGTMTLQQQGDVYAIRWKAAGHEYQGIGMRQGDWLIVSWVLDGSSPHGVVDYTLQGNSAPGKWTMSGMQSLSVENLKRVGQPGPVLE